MTLTSEELDALRTDLLKRREALMADHALVKSDMAASAYPVKRRLIGLMAETDKLLTNINAARALMNYLENGRKSAVVRMLPPPEASPPGRIFVNRAPKIGVCGKHTFSSESQAKSAIHSRLNKGSSTSRLIAYFCKSCTGWHMTSREPA